MTDTDNSFEALMATKTDEELVDYLIDVKYYSADEVSAAFGELQKRGKQYNEAQITYFRSIIRRKRLEESPDTPTYYSEQGVTAFCIFFSVLAGSILLSLNIKEAKQKWSVIGFGITYMVFLYILQDRTGLTFLVIGLNALGAVLLQLVFWNQYIGKGVFYHKKSLVIPGLIAFAVLIIYILSTQTGLLDSFMEGFRAKI